MHLDYAPDCRPNPTELVNRLPTTPDLASPFDLSIPQILTECGRRWIGPITIALILFEMTIRTFVYSPRPEIHDRLLGQIPAPGSTWVNGREGYGRVHWNRQGVRGRDLPSAANRNVRRIVVMGDSFCEAEGVQDNQTFCAMLENELSRRRHQDVWIGNCGRPGLDGADFLRYLPAYVQKFHPDLTVLTFNLSDFRVSDQKIVGITAQFDATTAPGHGLILEPAAESTEHSLLDRAVPPSLQGLGHALIDHSALALYGSSRLYAMKWRKWPKDKFITRDEQIATVEQMGRYFEAVIALSKVPVVCAYIAPWNLQWERNNRFDPIMEQRLREATAKLNIPYIATGATFCRYVTRTGQPANGFDNTVEGPGLGHLTPIGHRIVAEALAPRIVHLLADPTRLRSLRAAQVKARLAGLESL